MEKTRSQHLIRIKKPSFGNLTSSEIRFLIPFILFITNAFLSTTMLYISIARFFPLINYICVFLCLYNEVLYRLESNKHDVFEIIGAIIIVPLFIIGFKSNQNVLQLLFPYALLFYYDARNIDFRHISLIIAVYITFLLFIIIALSLMGFIINYQRYEASGRYRQYLGFRYALFPAIYCFNITMLFLYSLKDKLRIYHVVLLMALNGLMYYYTKSRLAFAVSIALLVFSLLFKRLFYDNRSHRIFAFFIPSFGILSIASYYFSSRYNRVNSFYYNLDRILENRVRLANSSIDYYGIHMFGNPEINWTGSGLDAYGNMSYMEYTFVDNLYMQILLRYGVVFFVVFNLLILAFSLCLYLNKAYFELSLFFFISLYSIIDNQVMFLQYNTIFLLMGNMFGNRLIAEKNHLYHFTNATITRKRDIDLSDYSLE